MLKVNGYNILVIIFVTFLASFLLTFLMKKVAVHINALDEPNDRKVHTKIMPRIGGLAIFFAFIIGYMFYGTLSTQMLSILIGGFLIVIVGMIDDINPIPAKYKIIFQILSAIVVVYYGQLYFKNLSILGLTFNFPSWINMILSVIFIVAIINAINLIDGLDGLAAGVSTIYFATIAVLAFILNQLGGLDIILSLIMFGAVLGFLMHNFPPAKIFMGDSGSMFLGFMISVIALLGYKVATITSLIVPALILFVPIVDTLCAIARRIMMKKSIGTPDKMHLHHQLLKMTSSPVKTVLIIYLVNIIFSAISIFYVLGDEAIAVALYAFVMILFMFILLKTNIVFQHKIKLRRYKSKLLK